MEFDDSLLQTTEHLENIDYDSLEGFDIPAEGKHLVLIEKVSGYMFNFTNYTGPRAKLKMRVIGGATPDDVGKYIYDDINLPNPNEKEGNIKRRVLIAVRLGLIPRGSQDARQVNWKALEGAQAVVEVIHTYEEKKKKTYANVTFGGYEAPETWNLPPDGNGGGNGSAGKETWNDI